MDQAAAYQDFIERFKLFIRKHPDLITLTLSNIFTMRLVGNKTHGDLAEIAIAEFINQYMYDFRSIHVGKDLYRAKKNEEDVRVINEITKAEFTISLKAYGDGPLQLSTDKQSLMFSLLQTYGAVIQEKQTILDILSYPAFTGFSNINVLPLIYNEKAKKCNILVFNYELARQHITRIEYAVEGKGRKHPVYRFYDDAGNYAFEVRYGDAAANALQRGLWTHTRNALIYFDSITNGWIDYSHNLILIKAGSHALLSTTRGHELALAQLKKDIDEQKLRLGLPQP